MPVEIKITGEDGEDALRQLRDLVGMPRPAKFLTSLSDLKVGEMALSEDGETLAVRVEESTEQKAQTEAKPKAKRTSAKKTAEASTPIEDAIAAAPKTEPAPKAVAAKKENFVIPDDINDQLSDDAPAPDSVQALALAKMQELEPGEGEELTLNYCRAALLYLATKKGMEPGREIMEKLGVKSIAKLDPSRFGEFVQSVINALA